MGRRGSERIPADMKSWVESFIAHRALLVRVVSRFVKPHEIEDIVQETFVRSYAASRKHAIRSPAAFMMRTARNLALNSANRAENRLSSSIEDCFGLLVDAQTPESESQAQEQFLVFCQAVGELPIGCRRAFILKKVYGLSQKEIAGYLGITESTVKKHIIKGMMMTTQYMLDHGYEVGGLKEPAADRPNDRVQES